MRVTRRYWAIASLGGLLAGFTLLFAQPILLIGVVGIGAWLLAHQYTFIHALDQVTDDITINQSVSRDRVVADAEVSVVLSATFSSPSSLALNIEATPPVTSTGLTQEDRTVNIDRGDREANTTLSITWPIAGSFRFDPPVITATDANGLFEEQLSQGPTPEVIVEPRGPHNIHVGEGGEQIATVAGEPMRRQPTTGLEPGELREYVPGDAVRQIDWKTTARLNQPHVREYEIETDRVIALLVDHRGAMNTGPPDETKLDYARQVALAFINSVRSAGDPLGCYTVGDAGTTSRYAPSTGQYATVKRRLRDLQITVDETNDKTNGKPIHSPATARRAATRLKNDAAFDATLHPYFAAATTYVERIEDDPLFETARIHLTRLSGTVWTVIFTDDTNRAEIRETVRFACRGNGRVLVFLTPTVLFAPGELADLEHAYARYREFEIFRRDLARLERVSAFEVGPGDRLNTVLSTGRQRRRSTPP
jgi:uncharacterized protein (DUF58 family)